MSVSSATSPTNYISLLPTDLQVHIMDFCTKEEIINYEQTAKKARLDISGIWLKMLAKRNLFFALTLNKTIGQIRCFSLFQKHSGCDQEQFIPSPKGYAANPHLLNIKDLLLKSNLYVLSKLFPLVQDVNFPITSADETPISTSQPNPIQSRFWKRVYLQTTVFDQEIIKSSRCKDIYPGNIITFMQFSTAAFIMQQHALAKKHFELFNLLEHYRFSVATDNTSGFSALPTYILECNLLVYYEITKARPPILKGLLSLFSSKRSKTSIFFDTPPCIHHSSSSQEEDKKMEEDNLITSIINTKYDARLMKDWPANLIPVSQECSPLDFAIFLANKESRGFFAARQQELEVSQNPRFDIVKMLIHAKADVNEPGLLSKCVCGIYNMDTLKLLIESKANINQTDRDGDTPLEKLLKNAWDDSTLATTHDILLRLLEAKADINRRNALQRTPLMTMIINNCALETFQFFLKRGPDRTLKDRNGDTALIFAAKGPWNVKKIQLLLSSQVFLNVLGGKKRVVRLSKAEINHRNNRGETALSTALQGGIPGTSQHHARFGSYAKYLIKAGADIESIPPNLLKFLPNEQEDVQIKKNTKRKNIEEGKED